MRRNVRRWIIGLGVLVGGVLLVLVAMVVGGTMFMRDAIREFETADASMAELSACYGPVTAFKPDPGGAIAAERIEAFLDARARVESTRTKIESTLAALSEGDEDRGRLARMFRKTKAGAGVLHQSARFVGARSEALMETDVSPGEYYYIYTLAYHSWLDKPPADGPSFNLVGDDGFILETVEVRDEAEVLEHREATTRRTLNRIILPMLQSQYAELAEDAGAWRDALAEEIAALEGDDLRLPWEDGLPPVIEESLRPYRERLEAGYSAMCNALETGLARRSLPDEPTA